MTALPPIAAVDVGSNSIHLTLARVGDGGSIEVLARHKDPARLAAHLDGHGRLSPDAIERALQTLRRFRAVADGHGADLRATATATIRAARNGADFLRRADEEVGIRVEVLTGADEARLTYRGVLHGAPQLAGKRILCVDVGGGSTELLVGESGRPLFVASVPWGSLLATERLLCPEPFGARDVRHARRRLAAAFAGALRAVELVGFDMAIATSGTAQRLARITRALDGRPDGGDVDGEVLDRDRLAHIVGRLLRAPTRDQRLRVPGLDAERADSIVGGALIFEALTRPLPLERWTVSTAALRTGLLLDTWHRR
jgi:exopolyphosphatase/pppGpp-phosphohydrolase